MTIDENPEDDAPHRGLPRGTPADPGRLAARAAELDAATPGARWRDRFLLPPGLVYLNGNSVGPLPAAVPPAVEDVVRRQWGTGLSSSWNDEGWWDAPRRVGERIAPLLGAAPGQVIAGDSTSVQLFNALSAATRMRPGRHVVLTDPDHFPTDRYIAQAVARCAGAEVVAVPPREVPEVLAAGGGRVAVTAYAPVDYRTGELHDMAGVTRAAHEAGALALWDLSHAAGALPLTLDETGVDLAVGCGYKYLSGGPGAPAFVYVARRHQDAFDPALTGWHGHADPFAMSPEYAPAPGAGRARIGCPPLLSMLALEAALSAFDGVDMRALRSRSLSLTGFFIECHDALLAPLGFTLATPRADARRGSQVALRHEHALPMVRALAERGVVGDMRPPDILRFGVNALYVSHADVHRAVAALREVTVSGVHHEERFRGETTVT